MKKPSNREYKVNRFAVLEILLPGGHFKLDDVSQHFQSSSTLCRVCGHGLNGRLSAAAVQPMSHPPLCITSLVSPISFIPQRFEVEEENTSGDVQEVQEEKYLTRMGEAKLCMWWWCCRSELVDLLQKQRNIKVEMWRRCGGLKYATMFILAFCRNEKQETSEFEDDHSRDCRSKEDVERLGKDNSRNASLVELVFTDRWRLNTCS